MWKWNSKLISGQRRKTRAQIKLARPWAFGQISTAIRRPRFKVRKIPFSFRPRNPFHFALVNIRKFLAFTMSFVASFYASSVVNAMKIPLVCQKKKKKQWKIEEQQRGGAYLQLGTWSIGHLGIWPSGNHFGAKWRNEEPAMSTSFLSNTLISVLLVILFFALFFVLHFLFLFLFFFCVVFPVLSTLVLLHLTCVSGCQAFSEWYFSCRPAPSAFFWPPLLSLLSFRSWFYLHFLNFSTCPEIQKARSQFGALMLIFFGDGSGKHSICTPHPANCWIHFTNCKSFLQAFGKRHCLFSGLGQIF